MCFTIAIPIATYRNSNEIETIAETTAESTKIPTLNATAATAAAETNHFSWSRSTPLERRKRTTSEATESSNATTSANTAITIATRATSPADPAAASMPPNGSDQPAVARIRAPTVSTTYVTTASQATGRQRGEGRCPVGNKRNSKMRATIGIGHSTLLTQASARPAGRVPGSARRAWTA